MKKLILYSLFFVVLISCKSNIYRNESDTIRKQFRKVKKTIFRQESVPLSNGKNMEWINTVNFNLRKPNFIILHHTAQDSLEQTIRTFTLSRTQVSAHYVISDDGKVVQMLNDYLRAWHGGNAIWGKNTDINSASIGIELDNNGSEPFSEEQISSLIALLTRLKNTIFQQQISLLTLT